jgi:Tfp pilus assembly protein PilN
MELIKINLLAPESVKREERTDLVWLSVFVVIIFVVLGTILYFFKLHSCSLVNSQVQLAQSEMSKYDNTIRQIDALESARKLLETKKTVINSLKEQGIVYPRFMEDFVSLLPSGISVKNLFTKISPDGKITVTLNADSIDNYPIADFITQLTLNSSFSDVELGTISTTRNANMPTISSFGMSFNYQRRANND